MKTKTQSQNLLINGYHSESSSSSPPASPRRSEKLPHCRRRLRKKVQPARSPRESVISFLFRRYFRLLLLVPLLYISGMLVCVGTVSIVGPRSLPGSVYRSGETFLKLWPAMQMDNETTIELCSIWKYGRRRQEHWKPCANHTLEYSGLPAPSGYLIVEANGGLNQQRSSICNAVAIAGLLNAILVIPQFHFHSIWKDRSIFSDIYDEDHFIETLIGHVRVVRELPQAVVERFDNNISNIPNLRIKAWAPVNYYMGAVFPTLREQGVIRISPFANRLAFEVPSNVQTLRCLANYQALRFSVPIATLAKNLVDRMIEKSLRTDGKYVSVHLRFEEDMVAFSCCVYDGGKAERIEMASERERGWKGKFNREGRVIRPDINRMNGKCPLTPLEVGMMLRGMGFNNNTAIYLASGEIYQAEKNLAPLLQMFPLLETKETLATQEELSSFAGFSSRLAALDYTVCLFSEVFVTTQGGNFPHFLMGHRRYFYNGHAKTVKPDKQKLAVLLEDLNTSWETFKTEMREMLKESVREGFSLRKKHASIYTFPTPDCMCYSKDSLDQRVSPLLPIPPANEKLTLSHM